MFSNSDNNVVSDDGRRKLRVCFDASLDWQEEDRRADRGFDRRRERSQRRKRMRVRSMLEAKTFLILTIEAKYREIDEMCDSSEDFRDYLIIFLNRVGCACRGDTIPEALRLFRQTYPRELVTLQDSIRTHIQLILRRVNHLSNSARRSLFLFLSWTYSPPNTFPQMRLFCLILAGTMAIVHWPTLLL